MMNKILFGHHTVLVKEVYARHRSRILHHLLALYQADRVLRFGSNVSDEIITNYVNGINFDVDRVFGVFSYRFRLVGVGHLSFMPSPDRLSDNGVNQKSAEFGLSVSNNARGHGIGSALFERAAIHCRNANVTTLYFHCLSTNKIMMHLAEKAGMEIQRNHGEADAYLTVSPADPASFMQEAMEEQVANLDYSMKSNTRSVLNFFGFGNKRK